MSEEPLEGKGGAHCRFVFGVVNESSECYLWMPIFEFRRGMTTIDDERLRWKISGWDVAAMSINNDGRSNKRWCCLALYAIHQTPLYQQIGAIINNARLFGDKIKYSRRWDKKRIMSRLLQSVSYHL